MTGGPYFAMDRWMHADENVAQRHKALGIKTRASNLL
jgi:hypothetical protein